jgi:pimeloyl-ACP methyl ester carboxylesterase
MSDISDAGFDVWALDFPGYGDSGRYPEMDEPPAAHDALGRASQCARQIVRAVDFICANQGIERVSIIAHSWGTMATGLFANAHPDRLERLVFFGPIGIRHDVTPERAPAWQYVTAEYQWNRFQAEVPKGRPAVFPHEEYDPWIAAYLATDPSSEQRTPPSVKIPAGPFSDIAAAWSGSLPYDPARILAPVLLIRGEWDSVSSADDVRRLFGALTNAPEKEAVTLDRGTHVMHLETGRVHLYKVVESFLQRSRGCSGALRRKET